MRSPVAMISYSSKDREAAELLHDELALRCFQVLQDQHSFTDGSRISAAMEAGVEECDVFVAYLTPHSLYLDRLPDDPKPALRGELIPALRRRRGNLGSGVPPKPIPILLGHGLGDRDQADDLVRKLTGERVGSLWGEWLDQGTELITQSQARRVAAGALRAMLRLEPPESPLDLSVGTRGARPVPTRFTIDGSRLLGGARRPGDPEAWTRFLLALEDVRTCLEEVCGGGTIRLTLNCHLSAAFCVGRLFHQASRWSPVFNSRHGEVFPAPAASDRGLQGGFEAFSESGDLLVDIDLIGHDVFERAGEIAAGLPRLGGRISLSRTSTGDLLPHEISGLARAVAQEVRDAHAKLGPGRIHLMLSAPAVFGGLLGHHLTALGADVVIYELGDRGYVEALNLSAGTA